MTTAPAPSAMTNPSRFFENGLEAIDRKRFPKLDHAERYEVELGPGEALFIPSHWWHFTNAVEPCVVVVEFWDAPFRRWGYPIAWRSLLMKPEPCRGGAPGGGPKGCCQPPPYSGGSPAIVGCPSLVGGP